MSKVIRVTIANIEPKMLATFAAEDGYSGTVFAHFGFWADGSLYGIEEGSTLEVALSEGQEDNFWQSILNLLDELHEECAYVTFNGKNASLLWSQPEDKITRWTLIP